MNKTLLPEKKASNREVNGKALFDALRKHVSGVRHEFWPLEWSARTYEEGGFTCTVMGLSNSVKEEWCAAAEAVGMRDAKALLRITDEETTLPRQTDDDRVLPSIAEMRRVAAYMSSIMGLDSAAGKLLAKADYLERVTVDLMKLEEEE